MSIKVKERFLDEVMIFEVTGRITLGEGAGHLRDLVRVSALRGDRWIVLDLGQVSYIDSSGMGELVSAGAVTANRGGILKLVNLTKRVKDLLQITKLYTFFDTFEDQATAVRSFRGGLRYVYCPLCLRFRTGPPTEEGVPWPAQTCMLCDSEFVVDSAACDDGVAVTRIKIRTYFDEYIKIQSGPHYVVTVQGRLNRFSCSFLRTAWHKLPVPRRVMLVLDEAAEVEDGAPAVAGELLAELASSDDRTVVVLEGAHIRMRDSFLPFVPTYTDEESAIAAMQSEPKAGAWCVAVKR